MKLKINNQPISCEAGTTILQAAESIGISIPTMCYLPGCTPNSSCMICTVHDTASGRMIPSCSQPVLEGMEIQTEDQRVFDFRRTTLEMLLSEHLGDCEAPCQRVCPVHLDIPQMIRDIQSGNWLAAWKLILNDLPLPSILSRLCHAPCEGGCRRNHYDETVAISDLVRAVADWRLLKSFPDQMAEHTLEQHQQIDSSLPELHNGQTETQASVAVVGAGPAGLATAWRLLQEGLNVTLYHKGPSVGGSLGAPVEASELPEWTLLREWDYLLEAGLHEQTGFSLEHASQLDELFESHTAVVLATGQSGRAQLADLGLDPLKPHAKTFMTSRQGLFAIGAVAQKAKKIVQVILQAKQCAWMVARLCSGQDMVAPPNMYNSVIGRLKEGEIDVFVQNSNCEKSPLKADQSSEVVSAERVAQETERCMHCDCRAKDDCKLRTYSDAYQVRKNRFSPADRMAFEQESQSGDVIFEAGKCVKCGICINVTDMHGEPVGLAFTGRGYDVKTGVGLGRGFEKGLTLSADEAVKACPTGSLAFHDQPKIGEEPNDV